MGRDLIQRLEAIVANAVAVTLNGPGSIGIDAPALLADPVWTSITDHASEVLPVLARLERELRSALSAAPDELRLAAMDHRFSTIKWRPEPLPMPREITAFVVLESLRRANRACTYAVAKAHYESLRRPGARCDCAAKVGASFMAHRPEAPLELLDSSGVPNVAMDYLHVCEACATKWFETEGHDDSGSHSTWRVAPSDAVNAC